MIQRDVAKTEFFKYFNIRKTVIVPIYSGHQWKINVQQQKRVRLQNKCVRNGWGGVQKTRFFSGMLRLLLFLHYYF